MLEFKKEWITEGPGLEAMDWAEEMARELLNVQNYLPKQSLKDFIEETKKLWEAYENGDKDSISLKKDLDYIVARFKGKRRESEPDVFLKFQEDISFALNNVSEENVEEVENFVEICRLIEDYFESGITGGMLRPKKGSS